MKILLALSVLLSAGCLHPSKISMKPMADIEIEDELTQLDRQDLYDDNKLTPGKSFDVTKEQSRPTMVQGGQTFPMEDYLPLLQEKGIATDNQSPGPNLDNAKIAFYAWLSAGMIASFVGTGYLFSEFLDAEDEENPSYLYWAIPVGGFYAGYFIGHYHSNYYLSAARPVFEEGHQKGRKWARTYNRHLAKKLGLLNEESPAQGENVQ